ncbi:MAG: hypothetical protein ACP5HX_10320 [Thermoproteota archaeon]
MSTTPSERYTYPAWGFLFAVLAVISDILLELRSNPEVLLLFSLISILGGFPLGFMVTSAYYSIFNRLGGHSKVYTEGWKIKPRYEKAVDYLIKKGVKKEKAPYVCEFISVHFSKPEDAIYIRRRWFIIDTYRSLACSLWLGFISGLIIRSRLNFPPFSWSVILIFVVILIFSFYAYCATKKPHDEIEEYRYLRLLEILKEKNLEDLIPSDYLN